MGCSASEIKTIEQNRPLSNITSSFIQSNKLPQLSSSSSSNDASSKITSNQSSIPFSPDDLVASFNRYNFRTGKGIQLNTMNTLQLAITNQMHSPLIISKQEHYFTSLNEVNILSTNSFNSIDNNENFLNLLAKLKAHHYHINMSSSFKCTIPQVFFNEYLFEIKLLNINTGLYVNYQFNQLDRPMLFLFFDILSHEAMVKVKQISDYQKTIENDETKSFIFLPIMNIFIKEGSDLTDEKGILALYEITGHCFILTNPINTYFIKLFMLDTIASNKTIIINSNSEVCYINYDQAGYLSLEEINFYLHMRRSTIQKEYYTLKGRDLLIDTFTKRFRDNQGRFASEYAFDILFTNVNDMNYPVTINITHSSKDKRVIEDLITKTKEDISNMKENMKVFYSIIEFKNLKAEMLEAFEYIHKMLVENGINSSVKNYQLIIEIHNTQLKNVRKSYVLMFSIMKDNQDNFAKILDLCSANLYNNPQIAKLKIGYAIIPHEGIELDLMIKKCKVIKLFKNKQTQMKYEDSNKEILFSIKTKFVFILNPSFVFKDKLESQKVREVLKLLKLWGIGFTIVVFSYSEIDSQKLRWLNIDELYDDEANSIPNSIDKLYLNSSEIDNYTYFKYYSEDISIKLFSLKEKNILDSFIDIDLISIETITQIINSQINKDEGLKLLHSNSNKPSKYDYKKSKANIKSVVSKAMSNSKLLSGSVNSNQLTSIVSNLSYKKRITFPNQSSSFSSFDSHYLGIHLGIVYSDYLEKHIPLEEIDKITHKEGISSSITKMETREVILKSKKQCTICQEIISSNPLYMCIECDDHLFMCDKCYSEIRLINHQQYKDDQFFSEFVMNEEDLKQSQTRKWSHCHPLVYCYFNLNITSCTYFTQLYSKYNDKKSIGMKKCNFCDDGYIDSDSALWNIVISHMNTLPISDKSEDAELVICNSCLNDNQQFFINKCKQDIDSTRNNLLILRLFNSYSNK